MTQPGRSQIWMTQPGRSQIWSTQPENWMTQPELTQKMRGWSPTAARTQRTPRPLVSATKFRFAWPSTDDMHTKNRSRSRSRSQISDPRSQLVLLRVGNVRAACGRRACCVWATCVLRACCALRACVRVGVRVCVTSCFRSRGSGFCAAAWSPHEVGALMRRCCSSCWCCSWCCWCRSSCIPRTTCVMC